MQSFFNGMMAAVGARQGYESAAYTVVRADGQFEVRDYPDTAVAYTLSGGGRGNSGFRSLFSYISGANEEDEKIPMTTPVFMQDIDGSEMMAFVMPGDMDFEDVPEPSASNVYTKEIEAARWATYTYSGWANDRSNRRALEALQGWLSVVEYDEDQAPMYAQFDSPWIPGWMRRNEVMLKLP